MWICVATLLLVIHVTICAAEEGVCWQTVRVPRMRGKLETIPTEEKYLDYDCYLNTYDPFGCYRTRQSYRYEYVTEVEPTDDSLPQVLGHLEWKASGLEWMDSGRVQHYVKLYVLADFMPNFKRPAVTEGVERKY
ncbi:hypothetical protein M8J77_014697 [Diaphorina citri]|nr:hypothetical protein M8J77_014697 [Diaphorina citri]